MENGLPLYKDFKPKTINQDKYVKAMENNVVTLCQGPAGCGKSACAVGLASKYLTSGNVSRIVITRPVVEAGGGLGFLPGDMQEKIHPYLIPVLEELYLYLGYHEVQSYIKDGTIEIAPLEYMRGRNFHNSFMILDEAQNADLGQIKMFLTRIGNDSKCILNGDPTQKDIGSDSGFMFVYRKLVNCPDVATVELTHEDIIRSGIISEILQRLER